MRTRLVVLLAVAACSPPPVVTPQPDAGTPDAGTPDAGTPDAGSVDAGALLAAPLNAWAWIPIDGSECGAGARAGLGLNRANTGRELFLFLQGGGACWNTGTCRPSLQQFGPLCDYANTCLLDTAGGQQPTAVHVSARDPYPADGGGAFASEIAQLRSSGIFDRTRTDNPFREASFVFVPYCTGDLHAGATSREYLVKPGLFDMPTPQRMRFSGAKNMDAYLAQLKAAFPNVERVWLTGASGGGYGATFNFERVQRAFPAAEVHLLADSAPFVSTPHWAEWRDEWSLQLPSGCVDCADGGFTRVIAHLTEASPNSRIGLLSYDEDKVIAWFFYAPPGAANFLNPPVGTFKTNLVALASQYDATTNAKYFVVPGGEHVLLGDYGVVQADGGLSAPRRSRDGGTDLRAWIDAWAEGNSGWRNTW